MTYAQQLPATNWPSVGRARERRTRGRRRVGAAASLITRRRQSGAGPSHQLIAMLCFALVACLMMVFGAAVPRLTLGANAEPTQQLQQHLQLVHAERPHRAAIVASTAAAATSGTDNYNAPLPFIRNNNNNDEDDHSLRRIAAVRKLVRRLANLIMNKQDDGELAPSDVNLYVGATPTQFDPSLVGVTEQQQQRDSSQQDEQVVTCAPDYEDVLLDTSNINEAIANADQQQQSDTNLTIDLTSVAHQHQQQQRVALSPSSSGGQCVPVGSQMIEVITKIITPILFTIIIIVGLLGNIIVMLVILEDRKLERELTPTNLLILDLSLADLSFIIFCIPFTGWDYAVGHWVFGSLWCKFNQYLIVVCALSSIYTLVLMSCDRFMAIVYPIECISYRTSKNMLHAIVIKWIVILLAASPTVHMHGLVDSPLGPDQYNCRFLTDHHNPLQFQIIFFITSYLFPLILIFALYFGLLQKLWFGTKPHGHKESHKMLESKKRVTWLVASIVILFALCWCPIQIMLILMRLKSHKITATYVAVQVFAHTLGYMNSCVNPIVYAFASETFNQSFKRSWWARVCCCCTFCPLSSSATTTTTQTTTTAAQYQHQHQQQTSMLHSAINGNQLITHSTNGALNSNSATTTLTNLTSTSRTQRLSTQSNHNQMLPQHLQHCQLRTNSLQMSITTPQTPMHKCKQSQQQLLGRTNQLTNNNPQSSRTILIASQQVMAAKAADTEQQVPVERDLVLVPRPAIVSPKVFQSLAAQHQQQQQQQLQTASPPSSPVSIPIRQQLVARIVAQSNGRRQVEHECSSPEASPQQAMTELNNN